jgi:hypothetical protein
VFFGKFQLLLGCGIGIKGDIIIQNFLDCIFEVIDDLVDLISLVIERK